MLLLAGTIFLFVSSLINHTTLNNNAVLSAISDFAEGTAIGMIIFRSIGTQLKQFSEGWARYNILGNIIPFMLFGFLLPVIWEKSNLRSREFWNLMKNCKNYEEVKI